MAVETEKQRKRSRRTWYRYEPPTASPELVAAVAMYRKWRDLVLALKANDITYPGAANDLRKAHDVLAPLLRLHRDCYRDTDGVGFAYRVEEGSIVVLPPIKGGWKNNSIRPMPNGRQAC
jgi:hypothetical protein